MLPAMALVGLLRTLSPLGNAYEGRFRLSRTAPSAKSQTQNKLSAEAAITRFPAKSAMSDVIFWDRALNVRVTLPLQISTSTILPHCKPQYMMKGVKKLNTAIALRKLQTFFGRSEASATPLSS